MCTFCRETLKYGTFLSQNIKYDTFCREMLKYGTFLLRNVKMRAMSRKKMP